ncbi:hypothetical protein [Paenibacillus sp. A3]|uniref:hypothetical protein n=1 Tax=Paenibacillus sp. A3 TaxID=1337054 RepID=UPI000A548AB0|nr:hypothetical protein [Paenibacillus sp. A3]
MTQEEAEEIAGWKYEEPYSFYNMDDDPDDYEEFLDPVRRGSRYYSVYTESGLMGFFSFTPQEQEGLTLAEKAFAPRLFVFPSPLLTNGRSKRTKKRDLCRQRRLCSRRTGAAMFLSDDQKSKTGCPAVK